LIIPDCLGMTLAETRELLTAYGWKIKKYYFTGPWHPVAGKEDNGRVLRLRLVGACQVELVLAYVDIEDHQRKEV